MQHDHRAPSAPPANPPRLPAVQVAGFRVSARPGRVWLHPVDGDDGLLTPTAAQALALALWAAAEGATSGQPLTDQVAQAAATLDRPPPLREVTNRARP